MSDLISRSELLKHCHRVTEYDEAGFSMEYNAVSVEDIKNAPTAYDMDKVVKELEKRMEKAKSISEKSEKLGYERHMFYQAGKENAFNEAIWIVKGGVVNERD